MFVGGEIARKEYAAEEKPDGAPEWMVSFADMITILMSFFVVMFSIASGDSKEGKRTKQQEIAIESLNYRFGPKWKPFMAWSVMPGNSNLPGAGKGMGSSAPVPAVGDPGGTMLVKKKEKARIRVSGEGDTIAIGGTVRFKPGSAALAEGPEQDDAIARITDELAGKPQEVEIVATASRRGLPPGSPFHDRWELGYARCRATADLLASHKIEAWRFRLSVLPSSDVDSRAAMSPDSDVAVRVFLSSTLPAGK